jgi:O-glycosyl hydrolase
MSFATMTALVCCGAVAFANGLPAQAVSPVITIDGGGGGPVFCGFGGLSAGASSRLLFDYPEPERSQILDYLFKPNYGAALQILKVEIGGDSDSTCGSEASHMRTAGDLDGRRGYEWWLMKEAKARNPDIKLWGLEWAAPGWFHGGFWSADNITYLLAWLRLAKKQGLRIDYMGGWNESGANPAWYQKWRKALAEQYPNIQIVGADDGGHSWNSVKEMATNSVLRDAVDVIGVHDPNGARTGYEHCAVPGFARRLNKTIWDSELSSQGHDVGAIPLARGLNRQYIEGKMTANVVWSLISAWYSDFPLADTGLMLADRPWSGYYRVGKSIWVQAHTTQFTRPGWRYIDSACGYLSNRTSYVTLASPQGDNFTTVLETVDAPEAQAVQFKLAGFSSRPVHMWATDLSSDDPKDYFVHLQTIEHPGDGFSVTLKPRHVYTLSTTTGQGKGSARPKAGSGEQQRLPYKEDFESYKKPGRLASYFSDVEGGFETAACKGGREGLCYRQAVPNPPLTWGHRALMPPTTLMGDPRWWGDYQVAMDALLEGEGYVELLARVSSWRGTSVAGYHLQFNNKGEWKLYSEDLEHKDVTLASGIADFEIGQWHRLALHLEGKQIEVLFDGRLMATVTDERHVSGQIGMRAGPWQQAEFDNIQVTATGPWPHFIPHDEMKITATSSHAANYFGYTFNAANAIDDRPETAWSAEWNPPASSPQAITVDLGRLRTVSGLAFQPGLNQGDANRKGEYRIYASRDGKEFNPITQGPWPNSTATMLTLWPARKSRYIRLEAALKSHRQPIVGELNIVGGGDSGQ